MSKISKRLKDIAGKIDKDKMYSPAEGFELLKSLSQLKFTESVDVSINLGIDARKSDQVVRGATVLPNGTGKEVRVAVFTRGDNVDKAKAAGADIAGLDELAEDIKKGNMDFDVVIATPDAMGVVGGLGQILGPRGLMPNPKLGTITPDVEQAVKNAKSGQVRYRNDKAGIIHCVVGNVSFDAGDLVENLTALLEDLKKKKPSTSKGVYVKKVSISTTMGPSLALERSELNL